MTPLQLAVLKCPNRNSDGSCEGVRYDDRHTPISCFSYPCCLLAEGTPCNYYEDNVCPVADIESDPVLQKAMQAAVYKYRMAHGWVAAIRRCPDCNGMLAKHRKYCLECSGKRKRSTWKESKRRNRGVLSTDVPKTQ